ncbi:MAG TPA: Na+/H+ antiporter subunit E [Bacillota bacterium]|nr:Na+/H+ antiporter subunit E [Bacillota bacterium]
MHRRPLILFVLLLIFSIIISLEVDLQHILAGSLIALVIVWFWKDLGPRLPGRVSIRELFILCHCMVLLAWYIIDSNIVVAKTLLSSKMQASPVFMVMEPGIKSNWGRTLLATCITITPGTVTIDVDPDTGQIFVHALTEEIASGLSEWRLIYEIKKLETRLQGGA